MTIGKGTETLSGANTYTGTTTVGSPGPATLVLNGSLKSTATNVAAATLPGTGGTLTGNGSTSGTLSNSGTVKPFNTVSNTVGTLSVGGTYTQTSTGKLDIAVNGNNKADHSTLAVSGSVTLAGTLEIDTVTGFNFLHGETDYVGLLTYSGSASNDFTNFSYNGGSCTKVTTDDWDCAPSLNFQWTPKLGSLDLIVRNPEPGTLAVLATGLLGLMGLRRRRTQAVA